MPNQANAQLQAVQEMALQARRLGVKGVAIALVIYEDDPLWIYPTIHVVDNMTRNPDPTRGQEDKGTNYLAVAMAKVAQCLRTGKDSGEAPAKGEVPWQGAVVQKLEGATIVAGFSGGTEKQDYEIATVGAYTLRGHFDKQVSVRVAYAPRIVDPPKNPPYDP